MGQVVTVGLDLAKSVFQVHGVDAAGQVVVRRQIRRSQLLAFFAKQPACVIGMEACASSHHWARELTALGHDVKLMPAQYVKPYVKRGKNDAADAEAICEAVTRPTMRFVAIKSPDQQSAMMLHRVRLVLCRQRTQLSNALRAHLAEFGVVAPAGRLGLERLLEIVADTADERLPAAARPCLQMLADQLAMVKRQILENDRRIMADARRTELGRRLMEIPGVGPLLASAFVASVADPGVFRTGRDLAAWIGLVPRQNSSGGKERLGSICKAGHRYLRQMLVVGSMAVIRHAERSATRRPWLAQLLARKKAKVAAVALANKIARTVWAMMMTGERYRAPLAA
ncbi:IS110 family transposase [Sphingomonas sp. ID1715]|uniref:IS110 family transposase n=1 Tax=Sphingomonas sp. ID1715 TaxID=1656898 RepID=UPI0014899B89|nr:IS110 family transposase [Sphingomonas sp. ID1715]NNM77813.1 IS110 family transposase [Sphingomonas sp. ID1715]